MIKEGDAIQDDDKSSKLGDKEEDEIARRILEEFGKEERAEEEED